jgi:hypothetical protein
MILEKGTVSFVASNMRFLLLPTSLLLRNIPLVVCSMKNHEQWWELPKWKRSIKKKYIAFVSYTLSGRADCGERCWRYAPFVGNAKN